MITRSGLAARTLVVWAVKSVSVVWKVWTVTSSSFGFSFTVAWKTCVSDLLNASFWAKSTATRFEIRIAVHRGLHGVRRDPGRRAPRRARCTRRSAGCPGPCSRGRRPDPRLVGDRVGGEGLLRQGRPDDRHDLGDVDQVLEGVDGAGLIPRRVLEDQLDRPAVHPALLVEELLGDLGADDLLLAEERHVARLRDGDADRDRVGGVRRGGATAGAGGDSQGQDARENPLHVVPPTPVSMRGHASGCPGRGAPRRPTASERLGRPGFRPGRPVYHHIVARHSARRPPVRAQQA